MRTQTQNQIEEKFEQVCQVISAIQDGTEKNADLAEMIELRDQLSEQLWAMDEKQAA